MLLFAYDGSINGDWVARYAIEIARHRGEQLRVLHVHDGLVPDDLVASRAAHLLAQCAAAGVTAEVVHDRAPRKAVAATLVRHLPAGVDHVLVCGARRHDRDLSYLSGTVAEDLLRIAPCTVLAIRVVQPGLLGAPRNLLLPVRGDGAIAARDARVLGLFGSTTRVWLLLVKVVGHLQFHHLTAERVSALRREGLREIAHVAQRLAPLLGAAQRLEHDVVVSNDPPKEIAIQANRHKCDLILMGASERGRSERLLYGDPVEQVLRNAPCDVAVFRVPS